MNNIYKTTNSPINPHSRGKQSPLFWKGRVERLFSILFRAITLTIMLLFTFETATCYAQVFKGGASIGLLATQVDGDDLGGYHKPGLFLGIFANVPFKENKMKIQLEIDYAQKGSRSQSSNGFRYRMALHQIEIPVIFGWNCWKDLSLEAGLSSNIIASAKEYIDKELVLANGNKFYFFELGGIAGVSYMFKEHYALFFRFNYSFSPIGRGNIIRDGRKYQGYMWNNAMLFGFSYQF